MAGARFLVGKTMAAPTKVSGLADMPGSLGNAAVAVGHNTAGGAGVDVQPSRGRRENCTPVGLLCTHNRWDREELGWRVDVAADRDWSLAVACYSGMLDGSPPGVVGYAVDGGREHHW